MLCNAYPHSTGTFKIDGGQPCSIASGDSVVIMNGRSGSGTNYLNKGNEATGCWS